MTKIYITHGTKLQYGNPLEEETGASSATKDVRGGLDSVRNVLYKAYSEREGVRNRTPYPLLSMTSNLSQAQRPDTTISKFTSHDGWM